MTSCPLRESLNPCPLREWPDDDADDLNDAHDAAYPAASADAGPVVRRWLRKVTDTAPVGEQTAVERPHGKQETAREAGGRAEAPSPKKIHAAGLGLGGSRQAPKQLAGRKRQVPVSAG